LETSVLRVGEKVDGEVWSFKRMGIYGLRRLKRGDLLKSQKSGFIPEF
jgi:hypothetical protein